METPDPWAHCIRQEGASCPVCQDHYWRLCEVAGPLGYPCLSRGKGLAGGLKVDSGRLGFKPQLCNYPPL